MAKLVVDAVGEALKSLSPPNSPTKTPKRSPSKGVFNIRKSFQKRGSKLMTFTRSNSKDLLPTNVAPQAFTDEMIRLETVILSSKGRQLLIHELLSFPGDYSVKVRFISAVDTWDGADNKEEKVRLGQKIVDTFVERGSMFTISSLKPERVQALVEGYHEQLMFARRDVLEELSKIEALMDIASHVESIDGV